MQAVAIVGDEEIGVAIVVVVEEGDGVGLPCRLPYPIAHSVYACGVVALVYCASDRVLVDDVSAIGVDHCDLRASYSGIFRHLGECEVAVVDVEQVVVARVVVVGECAEVVIHEVADIEVEPAIAVHVGAGDAGGGANVNRIAESGLGDVRETAGTVVLEQAVLVSFLRRAEAQIVVGIAPCADIQVLKAVVVEVAGYGARAVTVRCLHTRLRRDIGKCRIAVILI